MSRAQASPHLPLFFALLKRMLHSNSDAGATSDHFGKHQRRADPSQGPGRARSFSTIFTAESSSSISELR